MVLFWLLLSSFPVEFSDQSFSRYVLKIDSGPEFFLERSTDMLVIGNTLYIAENQEHRVQKFSLADGIRYSGIVADKGEGPGEVWLPHSLAEGDKGQLFVRDNRGISQFDEASLFLDRFRWYTPLIDYTVADGTVYCATIRTDSADLIDLCRPDGTILKSALPKYLSLDGEDNSLRRLELYFYSGSLLSNADNLFYVNATHGDFFKMDLQGSVLKRRSITHDFGTFGKVLEDKVKKYMDHPELVLADQGFFKYQLFQDACLVGGKIYLLRGQGIRPDYVTNQRDIYVYDTESLELLERIRFPLEDGEFIWSFVVWQDGFERHIVLSLMTKDSDDYQLVELRR